MSNRVVGRFYESAVDIDCPAAATTALVDADATAWTPQRMRVDVLCARGGVPSTQSNDRVQVTLSRGGISITALVDIVLGLASFDVFADSVSVAFVNGGTEATCNATVTTPNLDVPWNAPFYTITTVASGAAADYAVPVGGVRCSCVHAGAAQNNGWLNDVGTIIGYLTIPAGSVEQPRFCEPVHGAAQVRLGAQSVIGYLVWELRL